MIKKHPSGSPFNHHDKPHDAKWMTFPGDDIFYRSVTHMVEYTSYQVAHKGLMSPCSYTLGATQNKKPQQNIATTEPLPLNGEQ